MAADAKDGRGNGRKKCTNASRELHSMFARCTGSDAATIVWSVMGLDKVEVVAVGRSKTLTKCSS